MKKRTLITGLTLLCAGLLFFVSCSNLLDSPKEAASSQSGENGKVTFNGSICVTGIQPAAFSHADESRNDSSVSRSALPSFSVTGSYYYYADATQTDGNGSVSIDSISNPDAFNTSDALTFAIELAIGTWEIEAGIKDTDSSATLLSDYHKTTLSDSKTAESHTFYPKPSQKGYGLVSLEMTVPSTVASVTAECDDSNWQVEVRHTSITSKDMTSGGKTKSGTYDVTINFYDENDILLYSTVQTINVFDNMTTNTWVSDESGLINNSGVFNLTADLISKFERTTFYVGQTTAATNVEFAASDTSGSGSPYSPLKTLKKAAEIIQTINDESSQYRIYICEDQNLSGLTESLSLVPNDKAINLTIQGFDPQNSERQFILSGYNESSQKSQFNGAFIKIAGKSNSDTIVTLRNLSIYGHKNTLSSASNGGGLLCSQAKVLLENVDIRDNECGEKGAGIFATSSSIVTIKDSYIEGNIVTDLDKAFGAGIALMAGATVYIEGNTHILENVSVKDGGGIGVSDTGSNKLYINDGHIYGNTAVNGGGVYNGKELYFSAGGISQNIATALGGGVYSSGSMFMYGSAVIGDSAKTTAATDLVHSNKAGAKGGGIYSTGNLYLGYSSWTSESSNTPQELTGGVFYNFSPDVGGIHQYADNTSYLFKMNSGSVSYNAGRGIYVGKCTFSMTGGTVQGNTAISGTDENTEYQLNGAGLYAGTGATITVSGGTITENHAEENGGGLYTAQNDSIIILEGGTISSNTADVKGNGIAIANGYLKMKGNASVDSNNDVYLASGKYIEITDALSGTAPVAKVTLADFSRGKTIVQAAENVTVLTPYKDYFAFTQEGWESKLSADKTSIIIDAPIYVAGQNLHPYCGVAGNDTSGNGTKGAPFATINKATTLMDDNTTEYTIYIDGTISGTQTIPEALTNTTSGTYKAQSLIIVGVNGLDENEVPRDELNGSQSGTTLKVDSNVSVSITNLKITGGNGSNGGGLSVSSSSTVKLLDGTLITGNEATVGGGVYNQGSLYMSGSAMVGKSTNSIATSSSNGNKATEGGAGIYSIFGAKLYLGYTSWTSTSVNSPSELTGGVCGNYLSNSSSTSAYGGGIYNVGQLYIDSGNISYNYAINGAGIYTESDITMTGGTIKGNEGNSSGYGGGVCVYNGKTFTMSGDSKILDNKNMNFGAGIYLYYNNCKLVMKGGEISGNIAETHGGAVYMHDYSSSNHSDMQISGSSYIPYGGAVNNNDIYMLDFNAKIKITDSLSDRQANNLIYITPNTYTNGKTILEAGTGVTLADEVGKFALTPNASDPTADWFISSEGTLSTPMNAELVTSENYDTVTRIKVTSATGMNQIATLSNAGKTFEGKTIILFKDVTLDSNFTPIGGGNYTTAFKGTFDGNNKTVSGLSGQIALFNYVGSNIDEGTVKDLTVRGSSTQAGIVNSLNKGRIEGCKSYVSVTHTGNYDTGGIAAFCLSGTIINCVNYGTVISKGDGLGGILGSMQGGCVVDSCVNKGTVQSTGASKTGGIVGDVFGTVRNCINTGEVSSSTAVVGGIAGGEDCPGTSRGVRNCANLAPVSGTYRVGGIAGVCDLSDTDNYNAIVKNCFNAGNVDITDDTKTSVGGVIGEILIGGSGSCILESNYYTGTAASGIGADNGVTVAAPRAMVPSIDQMNEWVNANNSGELYKTWILKDVDGVTLPVPDVGYVW